MKAALLITTVYTALVVGITTIVNHHVFFHSIERRIECGNCDSRYKPETGQFTMFCPEPRIVTTEVVTWRTR